MEEVRRGASRKMVGEALAGDIRMKHAGVSARGAKMLARSDATAGAKTRRVDGAGDRRAIECLTRNGWLNSEDERRWLCQSHPHVYLMLVEMCRQPHPARVIRLRRA